MARDILHVESRVKGHWALRRDGVCRAAKIFPTKGEAVKAARSIARKSQGELFIHRADGRISEMETYGTPPAADHHRK